MCDVEVCTWRIMDGIYISTGLYMVVKYKQSAVQTLSPMQQRSDPILPLLELTCTDPSESHRLGKSMSWRSCP